MFEESATRSIIKAVSWRVVATVTTTILVYVFTRRTDIAITVGLLEAAAKMVLYFVHERIWNRLDIGRRPIDNGSRPADHALASPHGRNE